MEETFGEEGLSQESKALLSTFPKGKGWVTANSYQYQGFWHVPSCLVATMAFQQQFEALDDDLIVATAPKSGTTWLKALVFAIANRRKYSNSDHPVLKNNPHQLILMFEFEYYTNVETPDLAQLPSPRIFGTHLPHQILPDSIKSSKSRIIYLCRNPKDNLISMWMHVKKLRSEDLGPLDLDDAFEMYCNGTSAFGPFWDHALGYWKASQENSDMVLFLKYEELKQDTALQLKRLAKFMGFPFSLEEESEGVVEEIVKMCSFDNMRKLEVNKTGKLPSGAPNHLYFREGKVGDSRNYLTADMEAKIDRIVEEKLRGSGLSLDG